MYNRLFFAVLCFAFIGSHQTALCSKELTKTSEYRTSIGQYIYEKKPSLQSSDPYNLEPFAKLKLNDQQQTELSLVQYFSDTEAFKLMGVMLRRQVINDARIKRIEEKKQAEKIRKQRIREKIERQKKSEQKKQERRARHIEIWLRGYDDDDEDDEKEEKKVESLESLRQEPQNSQYQSIMEMQRKQKENYEAMDRHDEKFNKELEELVRQLNAIS